MAFTPDKFEAISEGDQSLVVRIWPDATVAVVSEIQEGEFAHMSDDYKDLDLYDFKACQEFGKADPQLLQAAINEIMGEDPFSVTQ